MGIDRAGLRAKREGGEGESKGKSTEGRHAADFWLHLSQRFSQRDVVLWRKRLTYIDLAIIYL